jgi:6-phosphogluconolactonase
MAIKVTGNIVITDAQAIANITTISANGNANVGNLGTAQVLATANITAPQLISNVTTGTAPIVVTSTTVVANLNANALQGNVPSATAVANTIVQRNADANITANFFIGNGSQLTGLSGASISNGTSNVNIATSGGNVTVGVGGTANVATFTTTGVNVSGVLYSSGFIESPYPIVAPQKILNKGTGALTTITTAIARSSVYSVTCEPSGRWLYATTVVSPFNSSQVFQFSINQSTGALTSTGSAVNTGTNARNLTTHPSGKFLYTINTGADTIGGYTINQSTGALTIIANTSVDFNSQPNNLAIDPTGRFLYTTNTNLDDISQFSINQSTGALTSITSDIAAGDNPIGIVVDPSGRFVYACNSNDGTISQYSINQSTGALTSITTAIASGSGVRQITADPSGRFIYAINFSDSTVGQFSINQTTGALTSITTAIATGSSPYGIIAEPSGRFVYVADAAGNTVSQYSINQSSGALTSITIVIAAGNSPWQITADPTGRFIYVPNNGDGTISQFSINNLSSGSATIAGNLDVSGYLTGNGSLLTGISAGFPIANGTSNINIPASGGNINFSVGGSANEAIVTSTGFVVNGSIDATGNITVPVLISNIATGTAPLTVTSTTQVANLSVATAGTVTTAAQPNITSTGSLTNTQTSSLGVGTAASGTTGEIRATNNITAYYSSDIRLKENIKNIENSLDLLKQIRGVNFDWTEDFINKNGGEDGYFIRKNDVGVIAQEVQAVLPQVVAKRSDDYLAVRYEKIIPLLIEAIKELSETIDELKRERN